MLGDVAALLFDDLMLGDLMLGDVPRLLPGDLLLDGVSPLRDEALWLQPLFGLGLRPRPRPRRRQAPSYARASGMLWSCIFTTTRPPSGSHDITCTS